ncbi:MAG: alpha-amylase family glycosyl hydrolase [Arachnia sp.]
MTGQKEPSAPTLLDRLEPQALTLFPDDPQRRERLLRGIAELVETYRPRLKGRHRARMDQATTYVITYADSVVRSGQAPLVTLREVLNHTVGQAVSDVHLLPMFPWTSDDGFGVVDHRQLNPRLGTWDDVAGLGQDYQLMFDFVANHVSSSSPWFVGWLAGDPRYADFFISPGPDFDVSRVVRPRTSPLTHSYPRPDGNQVAAWTTFGPDQVDINAANPEVILELTDVLLGYLARGATTVRLDAIGYLWKASATTSIHLPGTHSIIKLWRAIVDDIAPGARILTETNVPHQDNITYFGDGFDEAHMVYQFVLPPLVLHTFVAGDASALSSWVAHLDPPPGGTTWFNFLASHDGIGMRAVEPVLPEVDRQRLVQRALAVGGAVSYATTADGGQGVYELNVSYLDALAGAVDDPWAVARRALAAHALLFSLAGVPAVYVHSLVGSSHDEKGMAASGINRRINRQQLQADALLAEIAHSPRRADIVQGLRTLLRVRAAHQQFGPWAPQEVVDLGAQTFAVRRGEPGDTILAVVNVSGRPIDVPGPIGTDVLTGERVEGLRLDTDHYRWIKED